MRRCFCQQGGALASVVDQNFISGNDRRCVIVGCFSLANKLFAVRNRCATIVFGYFFLLGLVQLAAPTQAQISRYGPRAGSNFSVGANRIGHISRRPNRRRQPAPKFDYRIDSNEAALARNEESNEPFASEEAELGSVDPAGFCDGVGSCDLEAGCGCEDSCEPGCGCDDYSEPGCGCDDYCTGSGGCDGYCEPACGCDDSGCSVYGSGSGGCSGGYGTCGLSRGPSWQIGFEWSFVKPRYSENVAYTTMTGDGANNSTFSDTEFDYDLELSPRVWAEVSVNDNWGWRLSYWQYDHSPSNTSTSPNANGFGEITHPSFGDVDISTTIPTDTFFASSKLNAYTIDLEALKQGRVCGWQLGVGGGMRYASVEQEYSARLRNTNTGNVLRGQIDYSHALDGFGPTMSLLAKRPLVRSLNLVCAARGSLLFGSGSSRMVAGEDLDLANPFTTTQLTSRDDLLPIGEARVGLEWLSPKKRSRSWQWMLSTAMEGQTWGNAGNASSETADLGFFGFNFGAGFLR